MAKDPGEIVIGANGTVRVAPLGTVVPASINVAPAVGWVDLGYVTEDGATVTDGKSLQSIRAWQSFYDLRRIVESRSFRLAFTLQQFNRVNLELALGGGEVTEVGTDTGFFRYVPPAPEEIDIRMAMVEWNDGDRRYRLTLPRAMSVENVEFNLQRTSNIGLALALEVLGEEGQDAYILDTDDPAFEPAA